MNRSSGILLPIFSLPSRHGIGTLGEEAYNFIDFLKASAQEYWQMLPLGPTGFGDSPYQSFSSYAGNPYFIDLDILTQEGLLDEDDLDTGSNGNSDKKNNSSGNSDKVDYGQLFCTRERILRKAFTQFQFGKTDRETHAGPGDPGTSNAEQKMHMEFADFCTASSNWLDDFALFMALKQYFGMKPWQEWEDEGIRLRRQESIKMYKEMLREETRFHSFVQFLFFRQWEALRNYARQSGIKFIGDIPIYVSMDSADAWASSEVLQLDEEGVPFGVGGVPPDYFSETGQLWGNPLYDWDALKSKDYSWWMDRISAAAQMFDILRIDHFRGFEDYWSVEFGSKTAANGKWMQGPGTEFINKIKECFPDLGIIAEDLGSLTPQVHKMVEESGFPGMRVLQFAFGSGNCCDYLPHRFERNSVVYTGTHDNTTLKGWLLEEASDWERSHAGRYLGLSGEEGYEWGFIRGAMSSIADLCIVQLQDYLELPGTARTNIPGTLGGNWQWRLANGQLTEDLAARIAEITNRYER